MTGGSMATPEEKLEKMLADFEKANPKGGKNLREILKDTPELKDRFMEAIKAGNLDKIAALSKRDRDDGVLGSYSPGSHTIAVPMDYLNIANKDKVAGNVIRSTLGHELGHAINKDSIEASDKAFRDEVQKIAKGPSPHDYTAVLKAVNQRDRDREAQDEIAGMNILAAHVKRNNPKATLEDLYKASPGDMQNYVDVSGRAPNQKYTPKAGLTFDENLQIKPTKQNIDAVGKHFYDGNGYPASYGQYNLDFIASAERKALQDARKVNPSAKAPEVRVDLDALGLSADPKKFNGVTLPSGFKDTSSAHTPRSPVTVPDAAPHATQQGHEQRAQRHAAESSPLFQQSVAALERLGVDGAGLRGREELNAVAAAMAAKAQGDGLQRIDAVVPSTNGKGLIAVQGDVDSPNAVRSYIDRNDAAQQEPERNLVRLQRAAAPEPEAPQAQQSGLSR
ncbi:MAG: hypothetical protein E6Q88_12080 [Lysobacteraceae bacterium]|nr:MAG: hypothetical protein E6Q88_12080 [Xanthomonadaceae bacterium]